MPLDRCGRLSTEVPPGYLLRRGSVVPLPRGERRRYRANCPFARREHGERGARDRSRHPPTALSANDENSCDKLQNVAADSVATWLTFRRSYSSWSHDKGVPGKVVAQLMGHANVDTTLNVYTQVLDGSVRAAVEKIGDELFTIVHRPEKADAVTN
jgi:integrase